MALPLLLDIVPESINSSVLLNTLIDNIVSVNNYHVTTVRVSLRRMLLFLGAVCDVSVWRHAGHHWTQGALSRTVPVWPH